MNGGILSKDQQIAKDRLESLISRISSPLFRSSST